MFRVIAFVATVAAAGTLAGTASAHPPDLYDSTYGATTYGGGYTRSYPTYAAPSYGASSYVAPQYSGVSYGTSYAPVYDATPLYSKTYGTPSYKVPRRSYSGYRSPSYGYRHRRDRYRGRGYGHSYGYVPHDGHISYGPYSNVPATEGLNYGYSGGPTFGSDDKPVINGVRVNRNPN